ncbi:MAG: hypothetical protein HGB05_14480 [Chloroflexi bacterium]|nr:hypothetical protein [Chloroflexota bacterium]
MAGSRHDGLDESGTARNVDLSAWNLSFVPIFHYGLWFLSGNTNVRSVYRLQTKQIQTSEVFMGREAQRDRRSDRLTGKAIWTIKTSEVFIQQRRSQLEIAAVVTAAGPAPYASSGWRDRPVTAP